MSKVFDCCNFLNENDLLEIRLEQHWDYVDKFIVLEAGQTHTGLSKPFNFNKERFKKYSSKLIYETIDTVDELMPIISSLDPQAQNWLGGGLKHGAESCRAEDWVRDHLQGQHHVKLLEKHGAEPEDVVILSPVDEIISDEGFEKALPIFENKTTKFRLYNYATEHLVRPMFGFYMKFHFYKMNLFDSVACCCQITEYDTLLKICPTVARSVSAMTQPCLGEGEANHYGWHFSCLDDGTGKMIQQKYSSWAHSRDGQYGEGNRYHDMNTPEKALERVRKDFVHRTRKVEISHENHPAYLVGHQEKFKHLIA